MNTTNTLLSNYKSGNMFWLIEPSSGQFTNHIKEEEEEEDDDDKISQVGFVYKLCLFITVSAVFPKFLLNLPKRTRQNPH
jgi:hypothetical protein